MVNVGWVRTMGEAFKAIKYLASFGGERMDYFGIASNAQGAIWITYNEELHNYRFNNENAGIGMSAQALGGALQAWQREQRNRKSHIAVKFAVKCPIHICTCPPRSR